MILRQQIVLTELNRNHSPICFFNSSQNSAATQDANLTSTSDLHRERQKEGNLRASCDTTVSPEKHATQ